MKIFPTVNKVPLHIHVAFHYIYLSNIEEPEQVYCTIIGVGRFRILGGPRFKILGGAKGGPNSQQAHDVVMTLMRRNDVASASFRRHVPTRFLIHQCQIITFLNLKI